MVHALGQRGAPSGSAGLGQDTVGGHVRSEAAHNPARRSGVVKEDTKTVHVNERKVSRAKKRKKQRFSKLKQMCLYFLSCAVRTQTGPITLVALSQGLENDWTHSGGAQTCKKLWLHHFLFLQKKDPAELFYSSNGVCLVSLMDIPFSGSPKCVSRCSENICSIQEMWSRFGCLELGALH